MAWYLVKHRTTLLLHTHVYDTKIMFHINIIDLNELYNFYHIQIVLDVLRTDLDARL